MIKSLIRKENAYDPACLSDEYPIRKMTRTLQQQESAKFAKLDRMIQPLMVRPLTSYK